MAPPAARTSKRRLSDDGATSGEASAAEDHLHGASTALTSAGGAGANAQIVKRSRVSDIVPVSAQVVTVKRLDERTSGLAAPTMLLTGHSASVNSLKFDPSGQHVASASFDRSILLWDVYGDCKNYGVLSGHKNAVLEVQWSYDSQQVVSASADKTVGVWDAKAGTRTKKFAGHTAVVNSCCPVTKGPMLVVSGSDDGTTKLWDVRSKRAVKTFENGYPVTAVCFSGDNSQVFSGGLDGDIKAWDLRKDAVSLVLRGHGDIVTSVALSPDGNHLLSNAMDATVRRWDVRPFVAASSSDASLSRQTAIFHGAKHSFERNLIRCGWSADMRLVACGSSDRYVYVWDADTGALRYHLPGHTASVNEVSFHPTEPILGSCGGDKNIYLGELAGL